MTIMRVSNLLVLLCISCISPKTSGIKLTAEKCEEHFDYPFDTAKTFCPSTVRARISSGKRLTTLCAVIYSEENRNSFGDFIFDGQSWNDDYFSLKNERIRSVQVSADCTLRVCDLSNECAQFSGNATSGRSYGKLQPKKLGRIVHAQCVCQNMGYKCGDYRYIFAVLVPLVIIIVAAIVIVWKCKRRGRGEEVRKCGMTWRIF